MIRTTLIRRWGAAIGRLRRRRVHNGGQPAAAGDRRRPLASESGFTLIEVLLSALMVGFIAIATTTGFTAADRQAASERFHNEAAVLAAQSQEALRSDSADALSELADNTEGHTYTQTVAHEKYTITQTAKWVPDSSQTVSCKSSTKETGGKQNVSYVKITSSVTWAQRPAAELPVAQSSIITPPDGSSLEVEAQNGATPEEPVSGVTAIANNISLVTGEAGCVIFGDIPSTVASLEVYKIGDVTPSGAWRKVAKELVITPNITTHYPVTLAPGGRITAEFQHEGKQAEGDTFVVANNQMAEAPEFEVGSTKFNFNAPTSEEGDYEPVTSTYQVSATTPTYTRYPNGNLFPFENSKWTVYAGDCPANNPKAYGVTPGETLVKGGPEATLVKVPMSYVSLAIYEGSFANHKEPLTTTAEPYEIVIKNTACTSEKTPNNAYGTALTHTQKVKSGKLEHPFQPFGGAELCLYNKAKSKAYRVKYTNAKEEGSTVKIYLAEGEAKEKREEEAKKEAEQRAADEKTEKEKQSLRSTEAATEKATKTADEKTEKEKEEQRKAEATSEESTRKTDEQHEKEKKESREKVASEEKAAWEHDEKEAAKAGTKAQKENYERKAKELKEKEKTNQEKREKEAAKETEERKTREAQEKTKQEARTKAEQTETEAREKREKEEKTKKETREKEEQKEAEAGTSEDTVEAGKSSC